MSAIKKLAGQTAIYGLSSIVGRFLNYLLVPLYTYTFPPDKYGIVTEFYAYVVVLQILLTYGMETGFFRFAGKKQQNHDKVFSTVFFSLLTSSFLFVVLIFSLSRKISTFIGYSEHPEYVWIFSLILAADTLSAIFFARLRFLQKAIKFALFKILNIIVNIGLNLFFILLCPKIQDTSFCFFYDASYGVGYIFVANLIASLFVLFLFIPDFVKIKIYFDFNLWKSILKYSLPLLVTGLAGSINEMADRILIKYWTVVPQGIQNATDYVMYQLGIYGANAKLAVLMMLFVQAFRYASEPFFFTYYSKPDFKKVYSDVMRYYIAFAFFVFLFIMQNLSIFKYFIGKDYYEGLDIVFPLFLSRILVGVFFVLSFWYKLNDVTKYGIVIISIGALTTVVFNYFLIPQFGYRGAAWSNFSAYFIMVLISYLWSRKYLKVKFDFKRIFLYLFFAVASYLVCKNFYIKNFWLDLLVKNIFVLLYIFIVLKSEKLSLISIMKPLKNLYESKNSK